MRDASTATPSPARKKHSATRSVAEVFGLDPRDPPTAEAIRNVLAGKRADGGTPQSASGKALPSEIVEGARKRFKAALDIPAHREASTEELAHLANGALATGRFIDMADYRRQIHATRPPVGFVDLTFSADKSLSVAWALAPTEAERGALLDIHQRAVADAMTYAETKLGFARKGQGGADGRRAWRARAGSAFSTTPPGRRSISNATTRKAGLTPTFAKCRCRRRIRSCTRMSPCSTACSPKAGASAPSISICWPAASRNSAPSIKQMSPRARGASASKPCWTRAQGLRASPMFRNSVRELFSKRRHGSRANGARIRRRQRRQLGRHYRRAKGRAPEGRRRGNATGQRDRDRRRTEKRFRRVARASGGRILPAPQRTAPRCDHASTGSRTAA